MKRLLAAAVVAGGLAAFVPPVSAAPLCGPVANVNCWNGAHYCRIWVAATRTCTHTS